MKSARTWLAAIFVTFVLVGFPAAARADTDTILVESETTYTVSADGGGVQVQADYELQNNDPSTRKKSSGRVYFYDRIALPVPKSAENIKAVRANGRSLNIQRNRKQTEYDVITVLLGRRLFFDQRMAFALDYDLTEGADPINHITRNVARFSAFLDSDRGLISAKIPAAYTVDLDSEVCDLQKEADWQHVVCRTAIPRGTHAFTIEAVRPTATHILKSDPIQLESETVRLEVSYIDGEEKWANKVVDVLSQSLPVLEEVMGFAYDGPKVLKVVQTTSGALEGYAGHYKAGVISVAAGSSRELIVHEGAHIWSAPFLSRWLMEGWAEWSAREAMRRVKMKPELSYVRLKDIEQVDLPLARWDFNPDIVDADEQNHESYGYAKSVRLVALLVKRVGIESLQEINRSFLPETSAELGWADSAAYYDALTASGADVDDLWADFVEP